MVALPVVSRVQSPAKKRLRDYVRNEIQRLCPSIVGVIHATKITVEGPHNFSQSPTTPSLGREGLHRCTVESIPYPKPTVRSSATSRITPSATYASNYLYCITCRIQIDDILSRYRVVHWLRGPGARNQQGPPPPGPCHGSLQGVLPQNLLVDLYRYVASIIFHRPPSCLLHGGRRAGRVV